MGRKKTKKQKSANIVIWILAVAHMIVFMALVVSGFSHLCHPVHFPALVSASLAFGPLLLTYCGFCLLWLLVKRTFLLGSLVGLCICAVPIRTYTPINFFSRPSDGAIKVMSYNVNNFCSMDSVKFKSILEYIKESKADLLCIQESDTYLKKDVEQALSSWPYKDSTLFYTNTLSFHSKFPILDKCIVPGPDAAHGAVIYRIRNDEDTLVVINSHFVSNTMGSDDKTMFKNIIKEPRNGAMKYSIKHLSHKVDSAGILRAQQADELMSYLEKLRDYPVILCGDFNDSPMSYVHGQLTQILNDSYTRGGTGPGVSYHEAGMFFRIDHILCSSHWNVRKSQVDNSIKSSDHYPIVSWLELKKQKSL